MSVTNRLASAANAPQYDPIVFASKDADWIETIPREKLLYRVRSTAVNGNYAVLETIEAPGSASPLHYHGEDEIFHVIEGTMTFSIVGEIVTTPQGTDPARVEIRAPQAAAEI